MLAGVGPQGGGDKSGRLGASLPAHPPRGRCPGSGFFSLFPFFSAISNVLGFFFQTKLCGGENPAFPAVSGWGLLTEGLAPRSAHQPPQQSPWSSEVGPISADPK